MKRLVKLLIILAVLLSLTSCVMYTHTVKFKDGLNDDSVICTKIVAHGQRVSKPIIESVCDKDTIWYIEEVDEEIPRKEFNFNQRVYEDLVLNTFSGCIAKGTMITMSDGSKKAVETITTGEMVKVFDHETGKLSDAKVYDIYVYENIPGVLTLHFADNIDVTIVDEHGFFDKQENKYVYINAKNVKKYIGHEFYNAEENKWEELKGYTVGKTADAYGIVTERHLNHLSNGMLTMLDGTLKMFANVFEFGDNLTIDPEKKQADIEKYGLYKAQDYANYVNSLDDFNAYCYEYLPICVGKGIISQSTLDLIIEATYDM